ncbi:MAG: domain containing protein [Flavipsychrobacter sp.]|nr:domain containing protein [Flavipsychrobacter sp.]
MNSRVLTILLIICSFCFNKADATHIVGGEFIYNYFGDTVIPGLGLCNKYQVELSIYEDCFNGEITAIQADDPAIIGVYYDSILVDIDTGVTTLFHITVPANFSNACVSNIPKTCLYKRVFRKMFYLPPSPNGYTVAYQKCCRNNAIGNIKFPGTNGSTYYCTIPPQPLINNSAVFTNYPPQIICLNEPMYYDNSAKDIDGDSLSYEFCNAYVGGDPDHVTPIPAYPPYKSVDYIPPYSFSQPLTGYPPIRIDPVTGVITGTPNRIGRYLVTICCNEWRKGIIINTTKREFQFVVTNCSKVVVANIPQYSTDINTYIVSCTDFKVNFENTSTGGFAYHWDFGAYGNDDTSNAFQPEYTYPDTGTFTVKLTVNPSSTCPDSIRRLVKVYPKFHTNFEDTGNHCINSPIQFVDHSSATIKPVTNWLWDFGDGDTSLTQNPAHVYVHGGIYNVTLVSQNIKNCIDTTLRKVVVQAFHPFAGKDTLIVKGESVLFNASGGTQYLWTPATNLSDSNIYNPRGYYPDTGTYTYYVHVNSNFGCVGSDTIKVTVINQAEFFVPTAFSPNGDGMNDFFRPLAVGYRSLNYFRVFNRWGQVVYYSKSLDEGWNGNFNNKVCELGVYFWEVSFTDRFGKDGAAKGDVTLIR